MRIACSYCGPRGNEEFAYLGDATLVRPPPIRPRRSTMPPARIGTTTSTCATIRPARIASCGITSPAAAPGWS